MMARIHIITLAEDGGMFRATELGMMDAVQFWKKEVSTAVRSLSDDGRFVRRTDPKSQ